MSAISASLVKELRDATGAGMMDCKRALEETGGDVDAARKLLREKGMASAAKRADRATPEGVVLVRVAGSVGTIVAVGCETEPVAKNDEFQAFARKALEVLAEDGQAGIDSLEHERVELSAKLGENIVIDGKRFEAGDGEILASYVHPPANKIGVLVQVKGSDLEAARRLAMHISFSNPRYLVRGEVPEADVQAEREVYEKLPDVQGKPADVRPKIIEGMLQKRFFAESVLADQAWIHDAGKTVAKALAEDGLEAIAFQRYALSK